MYGFPSRPGLAKTSARRSHSPIATVFAAMRSRGSMSLHRQRYGTALLRGCVSSMSARWVQNSTKCKAAVSSCRVARVRSVLVAVAIVSSRTRKAIVMHSNIFHIYRNVKPACVAAGSRRQQRGERYRWRMAKDKKRLGIQSVEVAGAILRALITAGHPAPLKEVARLARLHPGKAHRYLVSLIRIELVEQDAASGHYAVGPMAIALGLVGLRNVDVMRVASALLPSLRDEIDETVLLALWSARGPVVFRLEESARPVFMNIRVGSVLPLLRTATGRVFAAFLSDEHTRDLIEAERAALLPGYPYATPDAVAQLLTETRTR